MACRESLPERRFSVELTFIANQVSGCSASFASMSMGFRSAVPGPMHRRGLGFSRAAVAQNFRGLLRGGVLFMKKLIEIN
ncbi:MAG: hypothetical protein AB1648_01030 [Pseudomonadota bacterium]|jgi:hypothetical protein